MNGLTRATTLARERAEKARKSARPQTPAVREEAARAGKLNLSFPWQAIPFPASLLKSA